MLFDATQQVSPVTQDYLKAIWQSTEWAVAWPPRPRLPPGSVPARRTCRTCCHG